MNRRLSVTAALSVAVLAAACGGADSAGLNGNGTLVVQLTDAPFPTDSFKSVDIFVVRVDCRVADVDTASSNQNVATDSS